MRAQCIIITTVYSEKTREVTLLYRQRNNILTVEKQLTDPADILDRLERQLKKHHPAGSAKRKRIGIRPALVITYNTRDEAMAAERWIDNEFDV